ncbi:MAG: DUF3850 domain-containing protein [Patescibacteria group bacterium]
MSKRIIKKAIPGLFQDILDGKKNFDLRLNDFEIEPGDTLVLEEWTSVDPETRQATGRVIEKEAKYLFKFKLEDLWFSEEDIKEKGFQIISFD